MFFWPYSAHVVERIAMYEPTTAEITINTSNVYFRIFTGFTF
ncbi:hypothetical protein pPM01_0027 [Proteus phage pPM_01]|uniref:Uncharacterized protein n=1 Tax=Proteus phage pPM_01 TaxID=1567485 RepID=A0A0B4SJZ6_9CAUD|nr:hypothetical protein AVV65_gp27 [Proteus phage pPM_01]AJA41276.1 hypothetical protein pPM01_0027 [Proteus phage pPM_01]